MKQIEGQMSMLDIIEDKAGYSIGEQYRAEGYTNVYDAMPDHPCEVDVIDHEGNRFKVDCVRSFGRMAFIVGNRGKGYDICWWKETEEPKKCGSCIHMRRSVWGLMEYHGWACFGFGISYSQDPQQAACDKYEPKGECSSCKYRVWLHWDGKAHQGCDYAGGGFCKYERREEPHENHYRHEEIVDQGEADAGGEEAAAEGSGAGAGTGQAQGLKRRSGRCSVQAF